jgi:hypothetical protein
LLSLLVHDAGTCSFLILFLLFIVAVELNEIDRINAWEVAFMVNSLGFCLEKVAAMQEHGIRGDVYRGLLAAHHLMKVSHVTSLLHRYLGAWISKIVASGSPDDCLERV